MCINFSDETCCSLEDRGEYDRIILKRGFEIRSFNNEVCVIGIGEVK